MSKRKPKYLKQKPKRRPVGLIVLAVILALLAAVGFLFWKYIVQNIREEVTVEIGETVTAEDFLIRDMGLPVAFEQDPAVSGYLTTPGDYDVAIKYWFLTLNSTLHAQDTVAPVGTVRNLTVYSNKVPEASEFVTAVSDLTEVTASYSQEPDASLEGDQMVTVVLTDLGGNTAKYAVKLTIVHDEIAPVITGAEDRTICIGSESGLLSGVTVTDDLDPEPVLTVDDNAVDLTQPGVYEVTYTAVDASGNQTSVTSTITVVKDEEAPKLLGVRPLSIFAGSSVSYRSNVIVQDDVDANPALSIDSSRVDLSTPGTYTVVYTARDAAGNETSMETTITVSEQPEDFAEESLIFEAADAVVAKITNDSMSDEAKVRAVYTWVLNNCWYSSDCDKTDWMQAAYQMLDKGYGDCFGFYAVCRLLFDRMGLPNLSIQRLENTSRSTTHYWSMVSIDGGETYYHFDSCPHPKPAYKMCLVTDAELEWFNEHCPDYYAYDKSLYPATPEEKP